MSNKFWIVFVREYTSRLKSKGFILGTLLGPLLIVVLAVGPALIGFVSESNDTTRRIAVVDETGELFDRLQPADNIVLEQATGPIERLREQVQAETLDGYLVLPEALLDGRGRAQYYSLGGGGLVFAGQLESTITRAVREERILQSGAPETVLEIARSNVDVQSIKLTETGETADGSGFLFAIGYFMAFVMYLVVFIYGAFVMQGVMEEKRSRIVEVIVSSARPFQLMLGKVLGIGALGMTQMVAWGLLSAGLLAVAGPILASFVDPSNYNLPEGVSEEELLEAANIAIPELPISLFVYFILFFIGGYMLYASLFAAVGSAVEEPSDAQQFMLPITIPLILAIIFMTSVLTSPNGTLATWLSIIPLFSPVLMPARLAITNVPFWQSGLALVLLVLGFLASVWLSARIYRIGILMYGKKPTFKDLFKWIRYA